MARRRSALQDISTTPYSMRVSDGDSNLLPIQHLTNSPEEQIIRQRSRRSLMAATALEVSRLDVDADSVLRRTPLKEDSFSKHVRKRLLMSPQKGKDKNADLRTPPKKPRLLRRLSTPVNLKEDLKPYTSEELVSVIGKLTESDPDLQQEVRLEVEGLGDVKQMIERLHMLRRAILRNIPASARWGSRRDAHCYRHVKQHIDAFKTACAENGRAMIATHQWEALLSYVASASEVSSQLPRWDDYAHNRATRHHCAATLASHCMVALRHSDLTTQQYMHHRDRLQKVISLNKELQPCVNYMNKMLENNNYKPSDCDA